MHNLWLILWILVCVFVFVGFMLFKFRTHKQWLRKKNEDILFISNGKDIRNEHAIYKMLSDFVLTKSYIRQLARRFEILEPGDDRKIEHDTLRMFYISCGVCLVLLFATLLMGVTLYSIVSLIVMIYVGITYITFRSIQKKERILLKQMISFLAEVRHQYYISNSVKVAIYESLLTAPAPIEAHMSRIYEVVCSDDIEEETLVYNEHVPNRFLKMFLSICTTITRFDDMEIGEDSLFIKNLSYLRDELEIEIRKKEELKHNLGSLPLIACAPVFLINIVRQWAENLLPGMEKYYLGTYGILCFLGIIVFSLKIYHMIVEMYGYDTATISSHVYIDALYNIPIIKKVIHNLMNRNYGKMLNIDRQLHRLGKKITVEQLYIKRFIVAGSLIIGCLAVSVIAHYNWRDYIINHEFEVDGSVVTTSNNNVIDEMKELVVIVSDAHKHDKNIDYGIIREIIREQGVVYNDLWIEMIADEIMKRIKDYRDNYFMWYELLIALIAGVVGFHLPVWTLDKDQKKLELIMENEVLQFHSGIMLMMYIPRISIKDILEWMENFAMVFQASISACIDELPNGEKSALENLKETESYPPFAKLVDNMMDADRIGVRKAFDEVDADRRNFSEKRRQDNEHYVENNAAKAGFWSSLPFAAMILLYMSAPFMFEVFSKVDTVSGQLGVK